MGNIAWEYQVLLRSVKNQSHEKSLGGQYSLGISSFIVVSKEIEPREAA